MSAPENEQDHQGAERRLSSGRYPNVLRAITESPWAIRRETLEVIVSVAGLRAAGERFTEEQISERIGAGPANGNNRQEGAIAILPIYGVIMPRATLMSQYSGGTSLTSFQQQLKSVMNDPQVGSILLDINSPGGSVALVQETAALLRQARQKKPVVAVANTDAASAAYWLASQADELWVTPSGFVGSVGVYMVHDDFSAYNEKFGVKVTYISAGKFKVDGNPDEPLSDTALEYMSKVVTDIYTTFTADVAKGRSVSLAAVQGGFGEGRMVASGDAVAQKMADKVGTFDDALQSLATGKVKTRSVVAEQLEPEVEPEQDPEVEPDDDEDSEFLGLGDGLAHASKNLKGGADAEEAAAPEQLAAVSGEETRTPVDESFARHI